MKTDEKYKLFHINDAVNMPLHFILQHLDSSET